MPILEHGEHVYSITPRPLAELLTCPGAIGEQLGRAVERLEFKAGEMIFVQNSETRGLYLLLAGEFYRSAERREKRLSLGPLHSGDLTELAAVLGDESHTYSLMAGAPSAALLLPKPALLEAFSAYPPLRMRLLEELGREVSRAYHSVYIPRRTRMRSSTV